MRCLSCECFSLIHICKDCQNRYLKPSLHKRELSAKTIALSFYKYEDIKDLLHTKHTPLGYYIFDILAKNSFAFFAKNFEFSSLANSIAIDDRLSSGYSHTAVLNHSLKSKYIKPLHNRLKAQNRVNYSGKSKEFRLLNPRNFKLSGVKNSDVILVDDIITTGTTLLEAQKIIENSNNNLLFSLTLADAR